MAQGSPRRARRGLLRHRGRPAAADVSKPDREPSPSLYLGDGIEADYISSLSGSEFLMDLGTLHRRVKQP